ncbi:MAG: CapA family protein [Bacteroidales bacterium]|nr:CapA family protein [Bacteroidales bacterium]
MSVEIITKGLSRLMRLFSLCVLMIAASCSQNHRNYKTDILFMGDLAFGESYQQVLGNRGKPNILKTKGYLYSFEQIKPIMGNSNFIVANLETPICPYDSSQKISDKKKYLHFADTAIAPKILSKLSIDAVSLANNHSLDFGEFGLGQTLDLLKKQKIKCFGAGNDLSKAAEPLVIPLVKDDFVKNIYIMGCYEYNRSYDESYSFYANQNKPGVFLLSDVTLKMIQTIKSNDKDAFVILFPHWGENYKWKNNSQSKWARKLIDSGADLIIGHGAHRMQEFEKYKGKWILYSLGNSVFNSPGRFAKNKSLPYSLLTALSFSEESYTIQCYPVLSDNKITNYQPCLIKHEDMILLYQALMDYRVKEEGIEIQQNEFGSYFELKATLNP